MKNISLFLTGLVLIVFAGLFHVYRYGMNEAKKPIPPPPSLSRQKPKAIEEKLTTSGMLPPKTSSEDTTAKIQQETVTPQIKADSLNFEIDKERTIGTSDLTKS